MCGGPRGVVDCMTVRGEVSLVVSAGRGMVGGGGHAEIVYNRLSRMDGWEREDKQPCSPVLINLIPSCIFMFTLNGGPPPFFPLIYVPIIDNHTPFPFLHFLNMD